MNWGCRNLHYWKKSLTRLGGAFTIELYFHIMDVFLKLSIARAPQCESPWEYEDQVDCYEVELKEMKVRKWVRKETE